MRKRNERIRVGKNKVKIIDDTVQRWQLRKSGSDVVGSVISLIVRIKSMEDVKHEVVHTFKEIHFSLEAGKEGRLDGGP